MLVGEEPVAPDDLTLLKRWCNGSDDAGDQLLRRCFPLLYRFFINKVGDDTDDLVQQTLMGCMRHKEAILERGAFRLYLLQIARSRLYDHLRGLQRRHGRLEPDFSRLSVLDAGTSFTSRLGRERAAFQVRGVLRKLPVDLQIVVELHYWEEQSTSEIAEVLEIPQGTVKSRLRRAREALEGLFTTDADEALARVAAARPSVEDDPL